MDEGVVFQERELPSYSFVIPGVQDGAGGVEPGIPYPLDGIEHIHRREDDDGILTVWLEHLYITPLMAFVYKENALLGLERELPMLIPGCLPQQDFGNPGLCNVPGR